MTTATQQLPADPARRLADKILARTNNGQELIDLLHDISKGGYKANKNDRATAANYLFDRGYGKCPKLAPAAGGHTSDPNPAPETDNNDVEPAPYSIRGAIRESPSAVPHKEPESPRLVTQIGDALHDSLGPAPSAHTPTTKDVEPAPYSIRGAIRESPEHDNPDTSAPFDPTSIQAYIIEITNDGDTLIDTLLEIARADDDDPTVTSYLRTRAGRILTDRFMGTDPNALRNAVCPECRRRWTTHPDSHSRSEPSPDPAPVKDLRSDEERLAAIEADLNKMIDEGILTPDPNAPPIDISAYRMPKDFDITPYAAEEAAAFRAEIELRIERQKQWPEIEERRRKKLAQTYPSHSDDDGGSPDT